MGRSLRGAAPHRPSLARLRTDVPLAESVDDLCWRGSRRPELESLCAEIGEADVAARMPLWRAP